MSNITKTFNVYKDMTYTIGMRSFGKEDLVKSFKGQPEDATISRNDMQNYVLSGIDVQPVMGDNKAVIDFSNVKLPWKFEYSDKMNTSRFAIAPLGTTVTQPKYVKELNATIVGSPTVTEDFIVKGFTSSSKLRVSNQGAYTDNVKFFFKLSFGSDISSTQEFMWNYTGNNFGIGSNSNSWRIWIGSGVTGTSIKSNTTYWVCVNQDGSGTKLYTIEDNGTYSKENLPKDLSQWMLSASTSTTVFGNNDYCYGGSTVTTGEYWRSSIDMNNCWIEIDGVEVWSGTQWVDRVLNGTKVGSPTITEDFIASGFSGSNYIRTNYIFNPSSYDWEWCCKFRRTENYTGDVQYIFSGARYQYAPYLAILATSGQINFSIGYGPGYAAGWSTDFVAEINRWYWAKLSYTTGVGYKLEISEDGVNWEQIGETYTSFITFNPTYEIYLAHCEHNTYLRGEIDLKETYIKVNGVDVWRGAEDLGTETLSGCVRYYYGEGEHVTTPPRDSTQYYNIYAVNGDEGIVLDSTYFHEGTMVYNRPIFGDGEIPQFENEWYLGEYRVETGEEGYIYIPIGPIPDTGV